MPAQEIPAGVAREALVVERPAVGEWPGGGSEGPAGEGGPTLAAGERIAVWVRGAARAADVHSHANPEQVRVRHVDLDLAVDFDRQRLHGHATLTVERTSADEKQPLILDSRKLLIEKVETSAEGQRFQPGRFTVGKEVIGNAPFKACVKKALARVSVPSFNGDERRVTVPLRVQ